MKHFLLVVSLLLLTLGCNRQTNQAVTQKTPQVKKVTPSAEMKTREKSAVPKDTVIARYSSQRSLNSPTIVANSTEGGQKAAPTAIAEITKTPCYGECAVFTLQIMSDYSLRYIGRQNVDLLGEFTGKLPFNPIKKLGPIANVNRFFWLKAAYPESKEEVPSDLPATVTMISYNGQKNTVTHYFDGPEGLQKVENAFLELVEQAIWTPIEEEE